MGRRRALAALFLAGALSGASAGDVPLREARWIAPEARFAQLSTYPWSCFGKTDDPASKENHLYGLVAFRDPLLLGGQAARAGLSCASCHRGGRGNSHFIFPGISGAPGTADITASLLSSHRGDGVFNPKPIPDLTNDPAKIARTAPGVLEAFIRGLIVEEFDGAEPPPRLLTGLAQAIRSIDNAKCNPNTPTAYEADLPSYGMALATAREAANMGDRETANAMLRAARSALQRFDERYPADVQIDIRAEDQRVARVQEMLRADADLTAAEDAITTVFESSDAIVQKLERARSRSLYNPRRLKAALNAARTP